MKEVKCMVGITSCTYPESMPVEEVQEYIKHIREEQGKQVRSLVIELDGDYVNLSYVLTEIPFERIRRITGYLVGDMSRWNDSKTAEEKDRVKHSVSDVEKLK